VAEVWFDSTAAMRESATTPEFRAVRADEPNFIDTTHPFPFIITRDFTVL
jgi:EthD domain